MATLYEKAVVESRYSAACSHSSRVSTVMSSPHGPPGVLPHPGVSSSTQHVGSARGSLGGGGKGGGLGGGGLGAWLGGNGGVEGGEGHLQALKPLASLPTMLQ